MAKMMKSSTLRCSLGSIQSSGLNLPSASGPARHEAGDLAGEVVDLELLDAARAALPGEQPRPARLDAATERRDEAEPGDDDASQHDRS